MPGNSNVYMAFTMSGGTATTIRMAPGWAVEAAQGMLEAASTFPLPSTVTPVALTANRAVSLAGFSSRSLIG